MAIDKNKRIVFEEDADLYEESRSDYPEEWLTGIVKNNFEVSKCFGEVTTQQYYWSKELTGEEYIKGLRTFSMHHGIDEEKRERLYGGISEIIERFGGAIIQPESVVPFHAKVKR